MEYIDTEVKENVQYTYIIKGIYNGIEQKEGVHPRNIKIYPKESITEKINIYYSEGSSYDGLRVDGDIKNAVLYIYEEKTDSWKHFSTSTFYDNNVQLSENVYTWANFDSNQKIKVGVSFLRENGRTAIEDYILELDRYIPDTKFSQKCTKNGVKITLEPDSQAVKYKVKAVHSMDEKFDFVIDGNKPLTCTFKEDEFVNEGTGISYGSVRFTAIRADGSRTAEVRNIYYVAPPKLVDANKNSDGYPVVKWSKSNINPDSTMHIYRKAPGGDWECIKSVETSSLKTKKFSGYSSYNYYFVDKTAEAGVEYTYSVQQEASVRDVLTKSYFNTTGVTTN